MKLPQKLPNQSPFAAFLQSAKAALKPFVEWVARHMVSIYLLNMAFQMLVVVPAFMFFDIAIDGVIATWVNLVLITLNQLALLCFLMLNTAEIATWLDQDNPRQQGIERLHQNSILATESVALLIGVRVIETMLSPSGGITSLYAWATSLPFDLVSYIYTFRMAVMLIALVLFVTTMFSSANAKAARR